MSCNNSSPLHQSLETILTYNHCVQDIVINYSLILLLQITVVFHGMRIKIVAGSTIYLWVFQVILCLIVGCVGVSVVWSAQLGILIHYRLHRLAANPLIPADLLARGLYRLSLVMGFTAWVYYAVVEEPIATLAHFCALVMGLLLGILAQR